MPNNVFIQVNQCLDLLRVDYLKQWNDLDIDFLICPASPSVASAHSETRYWGYTCIFNALDHPVATLPVSTVQSADTWSRFPPTTQTPLAAMDQWYRGLYAENGGPSKCRDVPISLQIVARRQQDEKDLKFARVIDDKSVIEQQLVRYWSNCIFYNIYMNIYLRAASIDHLL